MAPANINRLLRCCSCEQELKLNSKTLPCLHNLCQTCLKTTSTESTPRKCPKCQEGFTLEKCKLLPFLSNYIKRHSKLQCHLCSEEGIVSIGKHWCHQCEKSLCNNCSRVHRQLVKDHICKDLRGKMHWESLGIMMGNTCFLHGKQRELFCERCNMCYCDTCYKTCHSSSGCTEVRVFTVKAELSRRKTEEGPTLEKKVKQFERSLTKSSEKLISYSTELNNECKRKCKDIWQRYEEIIEKAQREACELCQKTEEETAAEVRPMQDLLAENERILKQIEIWLLSYEHLLTEEEKDADILCGLNLLKSKFLSWPKKWNQQQKRFGHSGLSTKFSNLYLEAIDLSLSGNAATAASCIRTIEIPQKLGPRLIHSILVTKDDNHIFLCDKINESIIELSESGEIVIEFRFPHEKDEKISFKPYDICSVSTDILVVCGLRQHLFKMFMEGGKIVFLKRIYSQPIFLITEIIHTGKSLRSLCSKNELVFVCDFDFNIYFFTKEGQRIKTIKIDRMIGALRIRIDPLSGNFWGSRGYDSSSKICSFDSNENLLDCVNGKELFFDYCLNKFGHLYFSTKAEIFSIHQEKKLLYKFDQKSKTFPVIFVSESNIFVCIKNNGRDLIKIFKTFY